MHNDKFESDIEGLKNWIINIIENPDFDTPYNEGILSGIYAYEKSVTINKVTYDYHFRMLEKGVKICRIAIERSVFDDCIARRNAGVNETSNNTNAKGSCDEKKVSTLTEAVVRKLNHPDSKEDFTIVLRNKDVFEILPIIKR